MSVAAFTIRTVGVAETLAFGRRVGEVLDTGWVIGLVGELGVGKTHLVKGIASGNWIGQGPVPEVTSPTFVLVNEYFGRVKLFHLDLYRLSAERQLEDLGIEEMTRQGAVVVEWADRVPGALPADRITIAGKTVGEMKREWELRPTGPRSIEWLEGIHGHL